MKKSIAKKSTTKKPVMKSGGAKKTLRKAQTGMATTTTPAPTKPKMSPFMYAVGNPARGEKVREVSRQEFDQTTGPKTRYERDSTGKPTIPMSGGKQFTDYTPLQKRGGAKMKKGGSMKATTKKPLKKAQDGRIVGGPEDKKAQRKSVLKNVGALIGIGLGSGAVALRKDIKAGIERSKEKRATKKALKQEAKLTKGKK